MQRVLFLCTGNSAHSQMAEAFLRKYGGDRFEAYSAGLEPKGLNPLTVQVMQEVGIDVSQQQSKGVGTYLGKVLFQYLITVCDDVFCKLKRAHFNNENAPTYRYLELDLISKLVPF